VKLLLERGADVHALDDEGTSPYQMSLKYGRRDIADLLREHVAGGTRFERNIFMALIRYLTGVRF
jgi:ankyrin repeat protein